MTNIVFMVGMRKDPKVGGGVGGTCEVAKNQTQHSPIMLKNDLRHWNINVFGDVHQRYEFSGNLAQAKKWSLERERSRQAVRFSLE
ncbi:hypothetical protein Lal_00021424 [Lupinus albus]|nr:hypothetical protein Lal_00021424 [Lupinus albus]